MPFATSGARRATSAEFNEKKLRWTIIINNGYAWARTSDVIRREG